jgi:hypothetical protein
MGVTLWFTGVDAGHGEGHIHFALGQVGLVGWIDPDGYVLMARALGDGSRPWRWTEDAVRYYEFVKAPLYQTALSALTSRLPCGGVDPVRRKPQSCSA